MNALQYSAHHGMLPHAVAINLLTEVLPRLDCHYLLLHVPTPIQPPLSAQRLSDLRKRKRLLNIDKQDCSKPNFLPVQSSVALNCLLLLHLTLQPQPLESSSTGRRVIWVRGTTLIISSIGKWTSAWVGRSVGIVSVTVGSQTFSNKLIRLKAVGVSTNANELKASTVTPGA